MKKISFNNHWLFQKKSLKGRAEAMAESGEGMKEQIVTLPHDAMIWEKREPSALAGGASGFYPGGNYEYSKILYIEEEERNCTFILEFEGIYNRGYVYVNDQLAGSVKYGYTGLYVDITPYLNYGKDNRILVKVINADAPNSRWYTGSGLYRPVSLYKGGAVYVLPDSLHISTPEISEEIAAVKVQASVKYDGKPMKEVFAKIVITDEEGEVVAKDANPISLYSQDHTPYTQRLYITTPKLWSVDTPYLYHCKFSIYDGENLLDEEESTFGIRKLELNPRDGLKLNGEHILLRGGCIHHDNGPVGAAVFARAEERRIEILKRAGFNSVRVSHNSTSKALLDACDRMGMLVMEESYDTWTSGKSAFDHFLEFSEQWEIELEEIVRKDFNHPSVFMYSIGNENTEITNPSGKQWSRRLTEKLRELDPTRYVTNSINGLAAFEDDMSTAMIELGMLTQEELERMAAKGTSASGDINDLMTLMMGQMNYLTTHRFVEERLKEAYSHLDLIGMNYMRGVYDQVKDDPNRICYGSETLPPDIDLNWKKVKEIPNVIGDYGWTAWDYIGEAGVGIVTYNGENNFAKPYPAYLAYVGDIDITGFRRPMSYYREIVFGRRSEPYIAVQLPEHYYDEARCTPWANPTCVSSWTWQGSEGKPCKVEVYSDAPEVELFVNDKCVGRIPTGEENRFRAVFNTIYEPGEIKAVAHYKDGRTTSYALKTAGKARRLRLKADHEAIVRNDLSYVSIELVDEKGIVQTSEDRKIRVTVKGTGVLQGFTSADPVSEENFFDVERTSYYGRALAVIRSGEEKGVIHVSAVAEGIETASMDIKVIGN